MEPTLKEAWLQVYPITAICVQRFDDSLNSAIRITYRISLRSSSLLEPRYPLSRVVQRFVFFLGTESTVTKNVSTKLRKGVKIKKFTERWDNITVRSRNQSILSYASHRTAYTIVHRGLIRGYVLMNLPQVHLRKPCYDFYFL